MPDTKDILKEIYSVLDRETVLQDLNPKCRHSSNGEYLELDCPECEKKSRAFIYTTGIQITCNRKENCGYSTSLWDYVQKNEGLNNQETLKRLAQAAGISLPSLSENAIAKIELMRETATLLQTTLAFFKEALHSPQAAQALSYLKERGYSKEELSQMDLGFNPGYLVTKDYLINKGYDVNIVTTSIKYLPWRDSYPIVFPYRDVNGTMTNIWGRRLTESQSEPKYKPYCEAGKPSPFFLDKVRGLDQLIIVEGYFDPMIALARGIKGMIGLGGSSLSQDQLETLMRYPPKKIILALDQDEAGSNGTEKAIKQLGSLDIDTFVLNYPPNIKDPDQYITTLGVDHFSQNLTQSSSAAKWIAKRIAQKHPLKTDMGIRSALREGLQFKESFRNPLDKQEFLHTLSTNLSLPKEILAAQLKETEQEEDQRRLKDIYSQLLTNGTTLLEKNDLQSLETLLNTPRPTLKNAKILQHIEPYTIKALQHDLQTAKDGLKTGYSHLDDIIRIPAESITLIAGRPSHGKTTLMLNLFLNMIQIYPNLNFCFFSYEETKQQIAIKILNILAGHVFQGSHNLLNVQGYLKSQSTSIKALEEAKQRYDHLVSSNRLRIIGEPYYVDDLVALIHQLQSKGPLGAVFIDYIQKIKNRQRFGTRQLELQKTSETLLEAAKSSSVPIILGAQLGRSPDTRDKVKLDNLREAGDLEQDANIVLGIFNPAMEKAQETQQPLTDQVVDLTVTPLKNRNGTVNKPVTLKFDRPILTIKEPPI